VNLSNKSRPLIHSTGEATGEIRVKNDAGHEVAPITVVASKKLRDGFDDGALIQAVNSRLAPGVSDFILNPDAHQGYGAPVGSVLVSPTHVYPGPVGVDIKCSMSLLQMDLEEADLRDKRTRRALINAILERTPTGPGRGQRHVPKGRFVDRSLGERIVTEGASAGVLGDLGVPAAWASRCEDSQHAGHDGTADALRARLQVLHAAAPNAIERFAEKMGQVGSYGGGNHFGECEIVEVDDNPRARSVAEAFGLRDGRAAFLSHCGSRGWGANLANGQFAAMARAFSEEGRPFPGGDKHMVYAELGSPLANDYLDDMALGANFATVNHLLINQLVLEAFQEVFPGVTGSLVYFISHNIARLEETPKGPAWVHRKGATRAFPAGHPGLAGTPFAETGHPILLPGNPQDGSSVMVADAGASLSCYSVNHGAGRRMSRSAAIKKLDQREVDRSFDQADIMSNCRQYPIDEAPDAYKDFREVLGSVRAAGLATEVARLRARFVIKDGDKADD
jgi:tRNA-splicing ligase RtcB